MVGGLLEAFSFWFGIRWLLLIAAGLYLASWIVLRANMSHRSLAKVIAAGGQ
jgi:hypothetical protein